MELDFTEKVLKGFKNIIKEIEKGSSEHDIRYKFVRYFVEEVLGYESRYIKWEKKRADLTIVDENDFAVIKIETKRPSESIDKIQHEEQAFKYEEETTKFIGLTNFLHFKLWEIKRTGKELMINIDFSKILEQKKSIERLSSEEKTQILFFNNLTKEGLFDTSKYEKFDETYARIDITKEAGFKKLLDRLNFIANNLLYGYTLKSFGEYKEGYNRYLSELNKAEEESKTNGKNHELNHTIAKYKQRLEEKYEKYKTFSGYELWKEYSGKEGIPDDEIKEIFCKETIYVFLNKLLFLRICEDKKLLEKNISNGGIEELRTVLKKRFKKDVLNKEILKIAFGSAKDLYSHFYKTGILDWFRTGDGELNELLNRVLWTFNQFDFTHIDRDILGNLYEKYLPSGERKRLGEFYTPTEIIDYILTSVEYTYSHDIETKDILDPACGSGGFLVRASRRLVSRYLVKFAKTDKRELRNPKNWKEIVSRLSPDEAKIILEAIQEHIYGLDINPFACHIAEMNLLFQIVDLYKKVREKYPDYKLKRFKIYRTDSLEKSEQKQIYDYTYSAFLEEQEEIDAIKNKKFDFVVGNPPYVRMQMLDEKTRKYLTQNYKSAYSNFDLYIIFIERGLDWLKQSGKFGFITSNQFMIREHGKRLRKYILDNSKILHIVDFARTKIFQEVTNYPTILIFQKSKPSANMLKFIRIKREKENLIKDIFLEYRNKEFYSDFFDIFEVNQNSLSEESWIFTPRREKGLWEKLGKVETNLSKISTIILGLQTGKDPLFMGKIVRTINPNLVEFMSKDYKGYVEKELLKSLLKGRDVRKWNITWEGNYVLAPHAGNNFEPIGENELREKYSNAYQFFNSNESKIKNRKWYGKNAEQLHGIWYALMYFDYAKYYNQPKILTPALTDKNNFALDKNNRFFVLGTAGVYGIIPKDNINIKFLLGILNSSLSEYFLKKICPIKQGGYFQYSTKFLEKLPIKLPETTEEKKIANQIIKKVDEILELHKSEIADINAILKGEETEKLYNLPKVMFSITDNAKFEKVKIEENKIYINSLDFIELKDKKIRDFVEVHLNSLTEKLSKSKEVKNQILNIAVPKSDKVLKEIIEKGGTDQSQIKDKIKKLEDEINELVYQIYGITKEDRKIVDGCL
ncbi:MAG: N-6 DNA methylase [Candidatus Aenigmarchaeota archaeon]|nr:N-6 DNA methylase [Candidatus Aenigmarchaeota archaeon]